MPKYDIESFKKIVNDIKATYKPEQSNKVCSLCDQPLSECKKCTLLHEPDKIQDIMVKKPPKNMIWSKQNIDYNRGRNQSDESTNLYYKPNNREGRYNEQYGSQNTRKYNGYDHQQSRGYDNQGRNPRSNRWNDNQGGNWRSDSQENRRHGDQGYSQQRNPWEGPLKKNEIASQRVYEPLQKPIDGRLGIRSNVIESVPVPPVEPRKKIPLSITTPPPVVHTTKACPLGVCTPPLLVQNRLGKRKRDSSGMESVSSEVKRRKKAEHVLRTFSQIVENLSSAIETKLNPESSIHIATESIVENMEHYTSSLHKSRSNLRLNTEDNESMKSMVYKTLGEELQSIYELSTTLSGKWRKKIIELGAENLSKAFVESRKVYPSDFVTSLDDEIDEGLLSLKMSEGTPSDILPLLSVVNDAEYSMKFMSFVQAIKAQESRSLKRERIQDVIKEYIIEDLNEGTKKETRKLNLLSQVLSNTVEPIKTIESALEVSVLKLTKMAKRAEKYFAEITEILQIQPSNDDTIEDLESMLTLGESPEAAWKRAFQKYSPKKEVAVSPIKQIEGNIAPAVTVDPIYRGLSWVLEMSEQFYYDNAMMLTNQYKLDAERMQTMLKTNFQAFNEEGMKEDFTEVVVLGSGSFGDVYRVTKKGTNDHFAIKYMKKFPPGYFQAHFNMIVKFLQERNYVVAARNSPFVVKFVQSFKIPTLNGFFLIFEWCLSDLRAFIDLIDFKDPLGVSIFLWESEAGGISKIFEGAKSRNGVDFVPVVIVYIFELFCALDFLAQSNIIHQDLKPENVMISNSLHLKIGDFGLVFNTKFITRPHQNYLIGVNDLEYFSNEPMQQTFGGTELYSDMELSFKMLQHYYPDDAKEIIYHADALDYDISSAESDPNFMSDLWAVGVVVSELLLGGTLFLYDVSIDSYVQRDMEVTGNSKKSMLEITYRKGNFLRYIEEGLRGFGGAEFTQLMGLLASIFKPRELRAADFVTEKEVYFYGKKMVAKYVDISKIEQIDVFSRMNLTSHNAFLLEMPDKLKVLLSRRLKTQYKTFGDLLQSTVEESSAGENEVLNLRPGTEIRLV